MNYHKRLFFTLVGLSIFIASCHNIHKPADKEIVASPEEMDQQISDAIKVALQFSLANNGKIDDSIDLKMDSAVNIFYSDNEYKNIWSHNEKWDPLADSLFQFIQNAELSGLFPNDYHLKHFASLKKRLDKDSIQRTDAALWTRADLMLTDGFLHIEKDLKQGRIPNDSISLNKDSAITNEFYAANLRTLIENKQLSNLLASLEPTNAGYQALKNAIPNFLDSMDKRIYTYVSYPFKANSETDSLAFITTLTKRLAESNCVSPDDDVLPDSTKLKIAIKHFQKSKSLKQDGLVSASLIRTLNNTDVEKFKRIAITLDRYKHLPPAMPERYIWVNLPAYYLKVWDHDTVAIESKVVCGKPATRTPLLTSAITNMVTYPTWTVPTSIIVKQYLPKLKVNPNYLSKLGLHLVDKNHETVDATKVKWKKYSKGIPYQIMQGSGDDNALGVFKFNFNNKYSVYLHDTNERYLFNKTTRSLSHGCVRVQQWEKLAFYIAENDSMLAKPNDKPAYNTDTILNLLSRKERKTIYVKNRLPLFIRYYTCEAIDGQIKFYDDMYGEDAAIRDKYFSNE
jgi:murein L,D-transpeptidase YcbB/YkuD